MLDLNKYSKETEEINLVLIGYARALLNFIYNPVEGCEFIKDNKEVLKDIQQKFGTVKTALEGDFTKAYAVNIGTKYILESYDHEVNHFKHTTEEVLGIIKSDYKLMANKVEAAELETNNRTTVEMLSKVKNNKVFFSYTNETLAKRASELSVLLQTSTNPIEDLAKIGPTIVSILSSIVSSTTFANNKYKHNVETTLECIKANAYTALPTTSLLEGYKGKLPPLSLLSKNYLGEAVQQALIDSIKEEPLEDSSIATYVDSLIYAAGYYSDKLIPMLKTTVNSIKNEHDENFNPLDGYTEVINLLSDAVNKLHKQEITNEEYMTRVNGIQSILDKCRSDLLELVTIQYNAMTIVVWITDEVVRLYDTIYRAIKFTE